MRSVLKLLDRRITLVTTSNYPPAGLMPDPLYHHLFEPTIIVPAATGVIYCNQVDGIACVQRALEGYLLPLPHIDDEIFSPDWWETNYNRRMAGDDHHWDEVCRRIAAWLARECETSLPAARIP